MMGAHNSGTARRYRAAGAPDVRSGKKDDK